MVGLSQSRSPSPLCCDWLGWPRDPALANEKRKPDFPGPTPGRVSSLVKHERRAGGVPRLLFTALSVVFAGIVVRA